jgi:hypothetical protein
VSAQESVFDTVLRAVGPEAEPLDVVRVSSVARPRPVLR